jgi:hypothetical protein
MISLFLKDISKKLTFSRLIGKLTCLIIFPKLWAKIESFIIIFIPICIIYFRFLKIKLF